MEKEIEKMLDLFVANDILVELFIKFHSVHFTPGGC